MLLYLAVQLGGKTSSRIRLTGRDALIRVLRDHAAPRGYLQIWKVLGGVFQRFSFTIDTSNL